MRHTCGESWRRRLREVPLAISEAVDVDEDLPDVSCALRSMAEVGLSARTRERGALLERWLAQYSRTRPTIHDCVIVRIRSVLSRRLESTGWNKVAKPKAPIL